MSWKQAQTGGSMYKERGRRRVKRSLEKFYKHPNTFLSLPQTISRIGLWFCGHLHYKFVHTCQCFPLRQKILQFIWEPPLNWSFCESLLELESSQMFSSCKKSCASLTRYFHMKHPFQTWNEAEAVELPKQENLNCSPGVYSVSGERPIYFIDLITHFPFLPSPIHTLKILNRHEHISGTYTGNLRMINYLKHLISCANTPNYFRPQDNWSGLEKHYWWAPRDGKHCKAAKQSSSFWH